jgi:predicted transposase YbfD/YdcC
LSLFPPPDEYSLHIAETVDLGHGRIEQRHLAVLPIYDDFLAWPGARLMLRMERTFTHKRTGQRMHEIDYALCSLDLAQVSAHDLLALWRGHWAIENRLHYVRDVTLTEDASRIRSGRAPQVMAAVRNITIAAARLAGFPNIAEALRFFAQKPYRALAQFILF